MIFLFYLKNLIYIPVFAKKLLLELGAAAAAVNPFMSAHLPVDKFRGIYFPWKPYYPPTTLLEVFFRFSPKTKRYLDLISRTTFL